MRRVESFENVENERSPGEEKLWVGSFEGWLAHFSYSGMDEGAPLIAITHRHFALQSYLQCSPDHDDSSN